MMESDLEIQSEQKVKEGFYRAAVIAAPGKIEYKEIEKPEPKAGQLLVKMSGCGLCASNIPVWEGREWFSYPIEAGTPGHEGWGVIEAVGEDVKGFRAGQQVALLDGDAFAEYVLADEKEAVAIPSAMQGTPFPGEPFGCTLNILRRADIKAGQTVSVIGLGFIGLSLIPLLKKAGAKVFALSRRESSREKALELGADEVIAMDDHYRIIDEVKKLTNENGCERVIECTGKQWPLDLAGELAGTYGKLVIAGFHQDGLRKVNMQMWNWKGLDIVNAHERDPEKYKEGIEAAIDAVVAREIDPRDFLSHRFAFEDLAEALNLLKESPEGLIKAYVKF